MQTWLERAYYVHPNEARCKRTSGHKNMNTEPCCKIRRYLSCAYFLKNCTFISLLSLIAIKHHDIFVLIELDILCKFYSRSWLKKLWQLYRVHNKILYTDMGTCSLVFVVKYKKKWRKVQWTRFHCHTLCLDQSVIFYVFCDQFNT